MATRRTLTIVAIVAWTFPAWADNHQLGEADLVAGEITVNDTQVSARSEATLKEGHLYLRAKRIDIESGTQRPIVSARAQGNARVSLGRLYAAADVIVYDMSADIITLDGNVIVQRGTSHLRGERGELNLKNLEVRIEPARGWVPKPSW